MSRSVKVPKAPKGYSILRHGGIRVRSADLYYNGPEEGWKYVTGFYSHSPWQLRVPPGGDPEKAKHGDLYRWVARRTAIRAFLDRRGKP